MTVYGDLDVSVLDELPPGRTPIVTKWAAGPLLEALMWSSIRDAVAHGQQAFVVCPLIEESDKIEVASAETIYADLQVGELQGLRLGLLHGRMSSADKEETMNKYSRLLGTVGAAALAVTGGHGRPKVGVKIAGDLQIAIDDRL